MILRELAFSLRLDCESLEVGCLLLLTKFCLHMAHGPQVAYCTCCLSGHPSKYWTGWLLLNFDDLAGTGALVELVRFKSMGQIDLFGS